MIHAGQSGVKSSAHDFLVPRVGSGDPNARGVAETLGISAKTADTHRTNLMRKLNLHSTAQVVRYAIRNQIVQP